jgi:hypothetical protein
MRTTARCKPIHAPAFIQGIEVGIVGAGQSCQETAKRMVSAAVKKTIRREESYDRNCPSISSSPPEKKRPNPTPSKHLVARIVTRHECLFRRAAALLGAKDDAHLRRYHVGGDRERRRIEKDIEGVKVEDDRVGRERQCKVLG